MAENGAVVVGTDGLEGGRAAVRWAAQEAERRGLPLRIVVAGGLDALVWGVTSEALWREIVAHRKAWANNAANEAADLARQNAASVEPETALYVEKLAVPALQHEAESADLLVLGARSETGVVRSRLGSTAIALTQEAICPIVVVPSSVDGPVDADRGDIIVGAEGSPSSQRAVEFAFAEAASRGTGLTAIYAWTIPVFPERVPTGYEAVARPAFQSEGAALLSESLAESREKYPDVAVVEQVVEERPAEALVRASQEAPLLAVGSRGRGGLTGLLLGSVSHAVLHRAQCPVAVLPG